MELFLAIFFIILIFLPIGILITVIAYRMYDFFLRPIVIRIKLSSGISQEQKNILEKKFEYYKKLSPSMKIQFERRLKFFLMDKEFAARHMPDITEEMTVLIGAAAVQITFGYKPLQLSHFTTILVYPEAYLSKATGKKHKGEVNSRGIIVFSWRDFVKGFSDPRDGYNVGLHEMAHALKIEDYTPTDESGFIDDSALANWFRVSTEEYNRLRAGHPSFIRAYGGTNREEFFAVCVEQFFEQAEQFKAKLPTLYDALARFLNQDPLNADYRYVPQIMRNRAA